MPWSPDMPTLLHEGFAKCPEFTWNVPSHYDTATMRKKIQKKFIQTLKHDDFNWGGPEENSVLLSVGFRVCFFLWLPEPPPGRRVLLKFFTAVIGDESPDLDDNFFYIFMKESEYEEIKSTYRKAIGYVSPSRSPTRPLFSHEESTDEGSSPSSVSSYGSGYTARYSPY